MYYIFIIILLRRMAKTPIVSKLYYLLFIIHIFLFSFQLRDNAQRELKQLREDLIEKKINLTLTKSQKSLVVINAENITAQ